MKFVKLLVVWPNGTIKARLFKVDAIASIDESGGEAANALVTMTDETGFFVADTLDEIAQLLN